MDYPVADPDFASLRISSGSGIPMGQVGWENAGPSAAFVINARDLADGIGGKQALVVNQGVSNICLMHVYSFTDHCSR
jgi:hypothetical protein